MADPICRWRNPYINTIVELVNALPHKEMPSYEFRTLVEERWPGFLHTPYQLACQVGLYYESEDGIYYPRFDHDIDENEASSYMKKWITRYYVPNPYTKSMKTLQQPLPFLASIIGYIFEHPDETELHSILEAVFQEKIGNIDIISNVLNTYTDLIKVDTNGHVELSAKAIEFMKQYIDRNDKKAFFEYFSESKITEDEATSKNLIFYGAPGTGKSFTIKEQTEGEDVIRTTFHPDSDYSTFVGCYKPTMKKVPVRDSVGHIIEEKNEDGKLEKVYEDRIVYEFVNQAFLQAYIGAWKKMAEVTIDKAQKQYLVIEEINRGNCAQIFGDLFQLLDRNRWGFSEYPIKADADMKKQIKKQLTGLTFINGLVISALFGGKDIVGQVLEGDILLLPPNLFIWATMNTSDQSLFPIDSAFKRRWDWKYVPIANAELDWVIEVNGKKYDWWDFLKKINALIGEKTHSEDKKLGYFFCKTQNGIIDVETFVGKVIFYLWNDVFKDFEFEDDVFDDTDDTENNKLTFDKFYKPDATVQESKVEVFLTNLKVELASVVEATMESEDGSDESNYSGYSLNGNKMTLGNIAMTVVQNYANNNPSMSAQAIRDYFINLCQGIGISHVVETEDEYHLRDGQPSQKRSASEITIPNGDKLYVSTQWRARNDNDNFMRFKNIVNNNGLGLIS